MLDFLSQVTKEFNVSEGTARQATGGLLQVLQKNAEKDDFVTLLGKLPGAAALLEEAPAAAADASSAGRGGLGGLMKAASSMLGGKGGGALGALSALGAAGLDLDDIPRFATRFLSYAKGQAGEGLLQSVLKNVPELKKLL